MPRNLGGVYSLPSGSLVTDGQTIEASQHNTPLNDLVTDANAARPIVAGGTGATTAADARTNLGLVIGTDVQAHDAFLDDIAALTDPGADRILFWDDSAGDITWLTAGTGLSISGTSMTVSGLTTTEIAAATLVTASDAIGSNNNDTTIPTSAAVKAYADVGRITLGTAVTTTSGTAANFGSIPATSKRVVVKFSGVSTNGTSPILIRIGSSGIEASAYVSGASSIDGTNATTVASGTDGFRVVHTPVAASSYTGIATLELLDGNTWVCSSAINTGAGLTFFQQGVKTIGGTLSDVRVTTVSGTDTFDAGTINVSWEG